ncbi:MAG: major tail protein [Anaerolineaceae bacterium]
MINSEEYKSVVGLDELHAALVIQDDTNRYAADIPEMFAPATNATAEPTSSQETQYANNGPFDVLVSEGETKITLETTNIPIEVLAKYLGKIYDTASGRMFDQGAGATPPDAALSFRSMKSNGHYRYFQYLKGKFSVPKDEASTVKEKKEPKPMQIIFTAVNTIHLFDLGAVTGTVKRVIGDEDSLNFSGATWFAHVQTPVTTTPNALVLSSSVPVDDAASVSVSANLTLTFSNALKDASVSRITLIKSTDGSPIASAISLDATKKIVTIDPTANLTAATKYYLVYAVEDIYGQTLNSAIDFTTA